MARSGSTIRVEALTRVEGDAGLTVRFGGREAPGTVKVAELSVGEPPRFFEALLRGRAQAEAPDITARVCGHCTVAHQLAACQAIEEAHGVRVDGALRALRRLLTCGEWIAGHAHQVFLLAAPDHLGFPDALAMARDHGDLVRRGLRMKKAGDALVERVGGRPIHPVNLRLGGVHRAPDRGELTGLLEELRWGRAAASDAVAWAAGLDYPDLEPAHEDVALWHADEYAMNEGRLRSSGGLDIAARDWERHFVEEQVERSTALQARRIEGRPGRGPGDAGARSAAAGGGTYRVGPLARVNLGLDRLADPAQEAASRAGFRVPCANPFRALIARTLELVHAFDEAARIIEAYRPPPRPFADVPARAGLGAALVEGPRGSLLHRYRILDGGLIADARIVTPTAQSQRAIEADLRALGPRLHALPHDEATLLAARVVRSYDPCTPCATH